MTSIKLHIFLENGLNPNGSEICKCGDNITLLFNQKDLLQTNIPISLKCSHHYTNWYKINVDFFDTKGQRAKNIKDVKSIIISQEIKQSNKDDAEYEHYAHWREIKNKRNQEIKDLKNDRKKILDKLNYESSNEDSIDDTDKYDLYEEMTLIGKQIRNHQQEINNIKKSSTELEYEDCTFVNSLELSCGEYKNFIIYNNDATAYINKYDTGRKCEVIWNFYDKNSSSMKRKNVSQEIHKFKLLKLHKLDQ